LYSKLLIVFVEISAELQI